MTLPKSLLINAKIAIPREELRFSFVRSSGPGGQNVNKVASKAVLRWRAVDSLSIADDLRERLLTKYARRINERGELILSSQRYRDQGKNVDDCLDKLRSLIAAVALPPRPRKKTRRPQKANEARLKEKRIGAERKQRRNLPQSDD